MKIYAALLIAALCATAFSAQEPGQGVRDKLVAKAKELQAKITQAIEAAKAKQGEVAKEISTALGQSKEKVLARLQKLEAQLQAKLKELQAQAGPILDKGREQVIEKAKARIEEAIKHIQALKEQVTNAK